MARRARLTAADVPRLKLKWAFAFPGDLQSYSQATLAAGRIFVGSWGGKVYSLDASSGCVHWFFDAGSGVRSAISIAESGSRHIAVFGDMAANVFALDAVTGQLIWRVKIDDFPVARVSASPTVAQRPHLRGVASGEEGAAAVPTYECCRFRGSIVALDVATGKQIWKTFMIPDAPKPTKKNAAGAQLWGPSGVPVWGTPVVDARRNALYVTTGNNYSDPTTTLSDAFVALDLASGKILWSRQMTDVGRLHRRLSSAGQNELRGLERTRPRLRGIADPGDAARRPPPAARGTEVRHRARPRSRRQR